MKIPPSLCGNLLPPVYYFQNLRDCCPNLKESCSKQAMADPIQVPKVGREFHRWSQHHAAPSISQYRFRVDSVVALLFGVSFQSPRGSERSARDRILKTILLAALAP